MKRRYSGPASIARVLATVLPDDAVNVFITLSARSLNKSTMIIARGESPSTVTKLLRSANEILPAHIGRSGSSRDDSACPGGCGDHAPWRPSRCDGAGAQSGFGTGTRGCGRQAARSLGAQWTRSRQVGPAFFIVAIDRPKSAMIIRPNGATRIEPSDGVVILGRLTIAERFAGFSRPVIPD
jgi:trk system potassium uptake protein TrkA/voltage-gated potassium channel